MRSRDGRATVDRTRAATLQLIAEGHSNKGIARTLGISVETVKWHHKQLYEKLAVSGRIQAVNRARKLGLMG
jgi:LuxR family maltose regulon positive regulatory protein